MIANAQTAPDLDEIYRQEKLVIDRNAGTFARLYRCDADELRSFCNELFMDAYMSWDRERSSFTSRLRYFLWYRMRDRAEMQMKQSKRIPIETDDVLDVDVEDVEEVNEANRTDHVQTLLNIVLPRFKLEALAGNRKALTEARREIRSTCRELGWTTRQVRQAWKEMKEFASA